MEALKSILINNLSLVHKEIILNPLSYTERLFISIIGILFYYLLCCALKRDWRKKKNDKT